MKRKSKAGSVKVDIKGNFDPKKMCKCKCSKNTGCGICGYFLGFLGAAVYYVSTADGFWLGVLGILKALVWPGFLVFELLKFIGA